MNKKLYIINDLDAYGDGATEQDVADHMEFARAWLDMNGYNDTQIETYNGFPPSHLYGDDLMENQYLADKIWTAYCNR